MPTIRADANQVHRFAPRIRDIRAKSTYVAFGLDVVCTLIAITGAIVLRRALRAHAELVERHRVLHEDRASALDELAGRVAHDILSPLATVGFALHLASQSIGDEGQRSRHLERGKAALARVKILVTNLLELARAGGQARGRCTRRSGRSSSRAPSRSVPSSLRNARSPASSHAVLAC